MQHWRGRAIATGLAAIPSIAFVATNAAASLTPALVVAAVLGVATFAAQIRQREPFWQAAAGLIVVGACAAVAAATGQARGFFLLPMLVPFVLVVLGTGSLVARRPLTGLILNRLSGGPVDWYDEAQFRRIYSLATIATIGFNIVSAAVQVSLYAANQTVALGAVHVVTGPSNLAITGVAFVMARRINASAAPVTELAT